MRSSYKLDCTVHAHGGTVGQSGRARCSQTDQGGAETISKLLYLVLNNFAKKWAIPIRDWKVALNQFTILFEGWMRIR